MLYAVSLPCPYRIHGILTQPTETQPLGICTEGSCAVDSPYSFSFGSTIPAQQKEVIVIIHRWETESYQGNGLSLTEIWKPKPSWRWEI